MEEWTAVHQDMYRAYIGWEEFLANQQRLKQNGYRLTQNKLGAPRKGPALLGELAVCGHCGHRMSVVYSDTNAQGKAPPGRLPLQRSQVDPWRSQLPVRSGRPRRRGSGRGVL